MTKFMNAILSLFLLDRASACYMHNHHSASATATGTAGVTSTNFVGITAAQIKAIEPASVICDGTPSCRTADQAAPFLNDSFQKYGFKTVGEQAAIFSLMAFESYYFLYDVNLSGTPGQGTRAMMMFNYVLPYALQTNATAVHQIQPSLTSSSTADAVPNSDDRNAIRATVLGDELSFGAGAWFLRTQCSPDVAQGLQAGTEDGFRGYMNCVGTGDDNFSARLAIYTSTLNAMGHS